MKVEEHHKAFLEIINKYELDNEENTEKVADLLTDQERGTLKPQEFAEEFEMSDEDATIFLSFIERGLRFKEQHIDKK